MLPADGGEEYNRLIHEKSPYLLQHAKNPVAWYPWGEEAFRRAREWNRPIFLSVGYSTCHWCHVMAHESFENEAIARVMNERFIPVKVDREERPDVDEIYMNVTQLLTGRGGWPNSVWLTPDGRPFFAGTYFPPEDTQGRGGFRTLLLKISRLWETSRNQVNEQADEVAGAVRRMSTGRHLPRSGIVTRQLVEEGLEELRSSFDDKHGGFGPPRPKFPPHGALELLVHEYQKTGSSHLLEMVVRTLDAIRFGGIHDHVGGGFARYSTDEKWFLPHFEKMLYDNAQLSRVYVEAYRITGEEAYRRTAVRTYEWVLREMQSETGGFYSAYDADSEGVEGKFYLWSHEEILQILGEEDGERFCRIHGVTEEGNYREEATGHRTGTNILFMTRPLKACAADEGMEPEDLRIRMERALARLQEVRGRRVWPHLDDKVLTSWNGLMIGSLAYGGRVLKIPEYVRAAAAAAEFILDTMQKDGRLLRTFRDGSARLNAYLDDYVFLAHGLLDLHEATGEKKWLVDAEALMRVILDHFQDRENGGFFFTSEDHEVLLARTKNLFDQAIPSGNGLAAHVLVRLALLTGNRDYLREAERTFEAFLGILEKAPRASESLLHALAEYYDHFPPGEKPGHESGVEVAAYRKPLRVEAHVSPDRPVSGEPVLVVLRLTVDPGWHVNANDPGGEHLVPLSVTLAPGASASLGRIQYQKGRALQLGETGNPINVYEGVHTLEVPVVPETGADAKEVEIPLVIVFQACNDVRCLAPERLAVTLTRKIVSATRSKPHGE